MISLLPLALTLFATLVVKVILKTKVFLNTLASLGYLSFLVFFLLSIVRRV